MLTLQARGPEFDPQLLAKMSTQDKNVLWGWRQEDAGVLSDNPPANQQALGSGRESCTGEEEGMKRRPLVSISICTPMHSGQLT